MVPPEEQLSTSAVGVAEIARYSTKAKAAPWSQLSCGRRPGARSVCAFSDLLRPSEFVRRDAAPRHGRHRVGRSLRATEQRNAPLHLGVNLPPGSREPLEVLLPVGAAPFPSVRVDIARPGARLASRQSAGEAAGLLRALHQHIRTHSGSIGRLPAAHFSCACRCPRASRDSPCALRPARAGSSPQASISAGRSSGFGPGHAAEARLPAGGLPFVGLREHPRLPFPHCDPSFGEWRRAPTSPTVRLSTRGATLGVTGGAWRRTCQAPRLQPGTGSLRDPGSAMLGQASPFARATSRSAVRRDRAAPPLTSR